MVARWSNRLHTHPTGDFCAEDILKKVANSTLPFFVSDLKNFVSVFVSS